MIVIIIVVQARAKGSPVIAWYVLVMGFLSLTDSQRIK
jgi:hypothetical protein